jgi:hypothetical protein
MLTIMNSESRVDCALPGWYAYYIGPFNAKIIIVLLFIIPCFAV